MSCGTKPKEERKKEGRQGRDGEVEGREELSLTISALIHSITSVIDA